MNKSLLEQAFNREFVDARDNWKGLCPFHDEGTPSFFVHKEEHLGNCFGCGVCGYIDVLLSRYSNISIQEARKMLDINVIERTSKERVHEPKSPEVFPESWLAPWPEKAHRSILKRGIFMETLKEVGARFDPSTKRQVFPHRDTEGNLIGAAGRATDGRDPKWYFYWSYARGRALYQPFEKSANTLLVVEGILDVLKIKQLGLQGIDVAATLGTQPGKGQVREIKEYHEVLIGFDSDSAGQEASLKLYQSLKKSCVVKFVSWPFGVKDPGEIDSKEDIERAIEQAETYVQRKAIQRTDSSSGILVQ